MCRWKYIVSGMLFLCSGLGAQEYDSYSVISEFFGNVSAEETDADDAASMERLLSRPLRVNMASPSRIKESGLFTHYQMICLMDYLTRHGDILSLTELSAVDGFGEDFVRKLAPFISLESNRLPGHTRQEGGTLFHELDIKTSVQRNDDIMGQYAMKYRLEAGDRIQAGVALYGSYDAFRPQAFSGHFIWNFRRYSAKIVAGDFNARFAQGLTLWNGMGISGLNRPSSYLKRASGISASNSFTGNYAMRGIAAESLVGKFRITAFTALTSDKDGAGLLPAANISWLWRNGQAGVTHYASSVLSGHDMVLKDMKTSCDMCLTINGVDCFCETAYDWISQAVASVAGSVFPAGESARMAVMLRYYPSSYNPSYTSAARALTRCSNEYGVSASSEFSCGSRLTVNGREGFGSSVRRFDGAVCVDMAYFPVSKSSDGSRSMQARCLAEMKVMLSDALALKLRVSERLRTWGRYNRTDLRSEIFYYSRMIDVVLRFNAVRSASWSYLAYTESSLQAGNVRFSLRIGLFFIDDWDDRIYAYERDIPGSFNVPAFYGRGCWTSLTGNWRFARWGRLYLRASVTGYPFMQKKKPGKAELKLMLKFQI